MRRKKISSNLLLVSIQIAIEFEFGGPVVCITSELVLFLRIR